MEEQEASEGQQILTQLRFYGAHSDWLVFRISRRKLIILIFSFCSCIGLFMGLLAWYLFENPDHHPPVPPGATHALIIIMLGFLVSALLLSMATWMTMKNIVLVLTPEAVVRGDQKKPKRTLYIAYRDIAAMSVDGSSVILQNKRGKGRKQQIDCRLFEVSSNVLAHELLAAYESFKVLHIHRHSRTH